MTISAAIIFNVQSAGSDNNGGGYKEGAGGINRSLQAAAYVAFDGTTIKFSSAGATTVMTLTGYTGSSANDPGNTIQITGGTNATAGIYEIISATSTTITVDRNWCTGACTNGAGNFGGAFATPGKAAAAASVAGNRAYVKNDGTYTLSTATPGSGGPVSFAAVAILMEGYSSTQADKAALATLSAGAQTSLTLFTSSSSTSQLIRNMTANGNSQTGVSGFVGGGPRDKYIRCKALNCSAAGGVGFSGGCQVSCYAENCETGFSVSSDASYCDANDCPTGFSLSAGRVKNCLAYGTNTTGFVIAGTGPQIDKCTAIGSTTYGFDLAGITSVVDSCLATGCGTAGFRITTTRTGILTNCFGYNNTANASGTFLLSEITTLSGDPFVNSGGEDYRPDSTVGEGQSLQAACVGLQSQINNVDAGAVQHSDPSGGGLLIGPRRSSTLRRM